MYDSVIQQQLWLKAGLKYCRMLQGEHPAILYTCIKQPFVIHIFVLSIFEWPLKTGFTVFVQVNHGFLMFYSRSISTPDTK